MTNAHNSNNTTHPYQVLCPSSMSQLKYAIHRYKFQSNLPGGSNHPQGPGPINCFVLNYRGEFDYFPSKRPCKPEATYRAMGIEVSFFPRIVIE